MSVLEIPLKPLPHSVVIRLPIRSLQRIGAVFDQVITLAPREEGNLVVLALKGPPLRVSRKDLSTRAARIEEEYSLPARRWAKAVAAAVAVSSGTKRR